MEQDHVHDPTGYLVQDLHILQRTLVGSYKNRTGSCRMSCSRSYRMLQDILYKTLLHINYIVQNHGRILQEQNGILFKILRILQDVLYKTLHILYRIMVGSYKNRTGPCTRSYRILQDVLYKILYCTGTWQDPTRIEWDPVQDPIGSCRMSCTRSFRILFKILQDAARYFAQDPTYIVQDPDQILQEQNRILQYKILPGTCTINIGSCTISCRMFCARSYSILFKILWDPVGYLVQDPTVYQLYRILVGSYKNRTESCSS